MLIINKMMLLNFMDIVRKLFRISISDLDFKKG